tara:strand:- start:5115 stop:5864 length:750 start_codon:yes stop_codon:yes gene_type:complete
MNKNPGIYIIKNNIDQKVYVGASKDTHVRLGMHKTQLRANRHHNIHLQNAYNKYGEDKFTFDILEECDEQYIYSQENYWCNLLNSHNKLFGYNIDPTAPEGKCTVSDETKIRMCAGAEKRPVLAYTIYGDFYKHFTDLYKCASYFETVAPNIHRKMNMILPKKTLIDSKSSKFIFADENISLLSVKSYWEDVILRISLCEGPYKVYTCFGTFVGTATSRELSNILGVTIHAVSCSIRRGTYLKTLKFTK